MNEPSERAMKAAGDWSIGHPRSTRIAWARAIDSHFPGYGALLAACQEMLPEFEELACDDAGVTVQHKGMVQRVASALSAAGVKP